LSVLSLRDDPVHITMSDNTAVNSGKTLILQAAVCL